MNFLTNLYSFFIYNPQQAFSFNSGPFFLLFTLFIIAYSFIYKNKRLRNSFIILFSLFFYYKLTGWYLFIMLLTASIDFFIALSIQKTNNKKRKFILLLISICTSLGLLIYFKYIHFIMENIYSIVKLEYNALNILIPLGISFYTFRTISYVIDVYREEIKPTTKYTEYIAYMSFFPLLIAGPITRAKNFIPQLRRNFILNDEKINKALFLLIIGLIKKAVIADYIGQYCNLVFDAPAGYSGFENLIAVYGFALQIYFDFSGYTDMAIGIAKLMGFDIGINFNKPYHSLNITEFWRCWHISLSTWLRDYVFTPMAFKFRRWGKAGVISSLFITFLICGFWHGANWNFIFWGGLLGLIMGGESLTSKYRKRMKKKTNPTLYKILSWFLTFHIITFLWIFFRSPDLQASGVIINRIFSDFSWTYLSPFYDARPLLIWTIITGFIFYCIPTRWYSFILLRFQLLPYWVKLILFIIVIQLVIQFQNTDVQAFIYAQF